jgi:hypothetical protein
VRTARGAGPTAVGAVSAVMAVVSVVADVAVVAIAVVLAFAVAASAGCRRPDDRGAIQDRLRSKGAAEVVREAAAARYTPPADGRLTEAQARMYLVVRERECRIREAAALEPQRRREAAAGATDLRAAQELKVNPKEYAWVRDRVLEAEAAATTQTLYQRMASGREQLLARMRRDRDALTDPERRAAAEREIEDWKRGLQGTEPPMTPAVRADVALLARFREPLARLRGLEERALAAAAGIETPGGSTR